MRVHGVNVPGVLLASVAFYFVGFLWYGLLFSEAWMAAEGITAADVEGESPVWMAGGFFITVLQAIGIAIVLKWRGVAGVGKAAATAFVLWLFFALPFAHYGYLYLPAHNPTLLLIDASHLLVGWIVAAIVLALLK
jgi:hypothetical protein